MADERCRGCRHFRNDAAYLEAACVGLAALSSGYGSVRSDDGICLRHDRFVGARRFCPDFAPADAAAGSPAAPI